MKNVLGKYLLIAAAVSVMAGCASMEEMGKGFLGISTKEIENNRASSAKKVFSLEYKICYNRALGVLKSIDSYVYAKDSRKNMVAVYVSEADTTPVGIFFRKVDAAHTEVEVSSESTFARDYISGAIFDELGKSADTATTEK